jgi:hypothetical protein
MEKIGVVFLSAGVSLFSRSWIKTKIPVPRICKKGSTLPEEPLGERSQKIAKGGKSGKVHFLPEASFHAQD